MDVPVAWSARPLQSKVTMGAISSGVVSSLRAISFKAKPSPYYSKIALAISVRVKPGAIKNAFIPCLP